MVCKEEHCGLTDVTTSHCTFYLCKPVICLSFLRLTATRAPGWAQLVNYYLLLQSFIATNRQFRFCLPAFDIILPSLDQNCVCAFFKVKDKEKTKETHCAENKPNGSSCFSAYSCSMSAAMRAEGTGTGTGTRIRTETVAEANLIFQAPPDSHVALQKGLFP